MADDITISAGSLIIPYRGTATDFVARIYPVRGWTAPEGAIIPTSTPMNNGSFWWDVVVTYDGSAHTLTLGAATVKPTTGDGRIGLFIYSVNEDESLNFIGVVTGYEALSVDATPTTQSWADVKANSEGTLPAITQGDKLVNGSLTVTGDGDFGGTVSASGYEGIQESNIPNLPASKTNSGVFAAARIAAGTPAHGRVVKSYHGVPMWLPEEEGGSSLSTISGTITDANGDPVEGVTVNLSGTATATDTTDAGGNYSFAGLAAGPYAVTPEEAGGLIFNPSCISHTNLEADAADDFTGTQGVLTPFGDSNSTYFNQLTNGPQDLYYALMVAAHGWTRDTGYVAGGTAAPDAAPNVLPLNPQGLPHEIYTIAYGTNDTQHWHVNADSIEQYKGTLESFAAFFCTRPTNRFKGSDTTNITYVGGDWNANAYNANCHVTRNRNPSTGALQTHSAQATVRGTAVFVSVEVSEAGGYVGAPFTVHIDGVLKGTFSCVAPVDVAGIYGSTTYHQTPKLLMFDGLELGEHTVLVTNTSTLTTEFLMLDFIAGNEDAGGAVFLMTMPTQTATGYSNTGVTPTLRNQYRDAVIDAADELQAVGLRVYAVEVGAVLNTSTDFNTDGVHLNTAGQEHEFEALDAAYAANPGPCASGDLGAGGELGLVLNDLSDAAIVTPADGEVLTYDEATEKWINSPASGGGVTDHGALTGLSDDDHPQYFNQTRGDARYPQKASNLSDLASAATARTNLGLGTAAVLNVPASGNAASGEVVKGGDTRLKVSIGIACSDETTALTTGAAKVTFRMPYGMTLTEVRASLTTPSSSGLVTVDINEGGTSVLSTKLSIDAGEKTSQTAATPPVISDASLAEDAEMTIDIDAAGTGATGLKVWLTGARV